MVACCADVEAALVAVVATKNGVLAEPVVMTFPDARPTKYC
jgi:hypothetical protein